MVYVGDAHVDDSPVNFAKRGDPGTLKTKQSLPLQAYRHQVGVIPVRFGATGPEVLLITSRDSRRWIIPKGWPMKGRKDREAAAREAIEEAGIKGKVSRRAIGYYTYQKRFADHVEPCRVTVFRLDVGKEQDKWRERGQRTRRWMSLAEAADLVTEPSLAHLLQQAGSALGDGRGISVAERIRAAAINR